MPEYATKDDLKRFVQFLASELRKADRPDLQWVLFGEQRTEWKDSLSVVRTFKASEAIPPGTIVMLQRERTVPGGIVRMTQ